MKALALAASAFLLAAAPTLAQQVPAETAATPPRWPRFTPRTLPCCRRAPT